MLAMIKLLIAPRNLRRYVGRHRTEYMTRAAQAAGSGIPIEVTAE